MPNELTPRIHTFIVDTFLFGDESEMLAGDASLLEAGIVDSTGVLELVMFLEDSFHIAVADDEVVPENFDSVNRMAAYVQSKLATAA